MNLTPLAIAMRDFSRLERRWSSAEYEDWDIIRDDLADRGHSAVGVEAYPHVLAEDPAKEWTLLLIWDHQLSARPDIIPQAQKLSQHEISPPR